MQYGTPSLNISPVDGILPCSQLTEKFHEKRHWSVGFFKVFYSTVCLFLDGIWVFFSRINSTTLINVWRFSVGSRWNASRQVMFEFPHQREWPPPSHRQYKARASRPKYGLDLSLYGSVCVSADGSCRERGLKVGRNYVCTSILPMWVYY